MITFKDYIGEATAADFKAQGYGGTSNRTKFQIGDYIVITDSQTRRGEKYINMPGKIVGYKPFSMTVKYAVEFSDGQADAYFGQMIAGPFKDEAAAIKYSKQIKKLKLGSPLPQIVASDLRGYVDKPLDTNPKFEAYLKQLLTTEPFDLQWLDKPLQFSDGKYTVTVLAIKPTSFKKYGITDGNINLNIKLGDRSLQNYLRNNICLLRQNNAVSSKLVTQTYIKGLPNFNDQSPYFMNMMWVNVSSLGRALDRDITRDIDFFNKKELNVAIKRNDGIDVCNVALPVSLAKNPKELIAAFKLPYEFLSGNYNPQTLFDIYYKVSERNGQKSINTTIRADETTLKHFQGYELGYNTTMGWRTSELIIRSDSPSKLLIPPNMNDVKLSSKTDNIKPVIEDFSFMPPKLQTLILSGFVIKSLNGLPNTMDKLEIELCNLPSLNGIPKSIRTLTLDSTNLKDFRGAEDTVVEKLRGWNNKFTSIKGIPKANYYSINKFTDKQIQKEIESREFVKNLDKETEQDWGGIIDEL